MSPTATTYADDHLQRRGDASRIVAVSGTLGAGTHGPAVGTSPAMGQDLANGVTTGAIGSTVTLRIDRVEGVRTTRNVIAETPGDDPDHVVVVGAHLDSVPRGPGIQDNGSGSAAILEIAEVLSAREFGPRNKVRFIWFSAEEFGLLGSTAYVADLSAAERARIDAMLNFDMIGSPNFVRFVYDGDNSAFLVGPGAAPGPAGSGRSSGFSMTTSPPRAWPRQRRRSAGDRTTGRSSQRPSASPPVGSSPAPRASSRRPRRRSTAARPAGRTTPVTTWPATTTTTSASSVWTR